MTVLSKDWPEKAWNRKVDAHVGDVWKYGFQFVLPKSRGSIPTTRTSSRFAGVTNDHLVSFGCIHFRTQSYGSTIHDLQETLTHDGAVTLLIPVRVCVSQDLAAPSYRGCFRRVSPPVRQHRESIAPARYRLFSAYKLSLSLLLSRVNSRYCLIDFGA